MDGKWNDYNSVMEEVKRKGSSLEYASPELKNNYDIVMEAVKNAGYALQFASDELRNNPDIVLEAAKAAGYVLQYASDELRNNKEFVKRAVEQDDYAIYYVAKHFRDDPEITGIVKAKQASSDNIENNSNDENMEKTIEKQVEEVELELKDLDVELEHLKEQLRNIKQERDSQIEVLINANNVLKQQEPKEVETKDECGIICRIKKFFLKLFSTKKVEQLPDNTSKSSIQDEFDSVQIEKVIEDEDTLKLVNNYEQGIITENDINKAEIEMLKLAYEAQVEKIKSDIAKVNEKII